MAWPKHTGVCVLTRNIACAQFERNVLKDGLADEQAYNEGVNVSKYGFMGDITNIEEAAAASGQII